MSKISDCLQVPTKVWDDLENDKLVIDICSFCKADQDECGEIPYCCYKEAYKEYRSMQMKYVSSVEE